MFAIGKFFPLPPAAPLGALALLLLAPPGLSAQQPGAGSPEVRTYFEAVASYFRLPSEEVSILGDWGLPPEEVAVVLFLSRRAGVSPEAITALRRAGRSWSALTERYDLGAGVYYVALPGDAGSLTRARDLFESRPRSEWDSVELTDAEITSLVNLKILSEVLVASPGTVLRVRDDAGSYPAAYARLARTARG